LEDELCFFEMSQSESGKNWNPDEDEFDNEKDKIVIPEIKKEEYPENDIPTEIMVDELVASGKW